MLGSVRAKGLWHMSCRKGGVRETPSHGRLNSGPVAQAAVRWNAEVGRGDGLQASLEPAGDSVFPRQVCRLQQCSG